MESFLSWSNGQQLRNVLTMHIYWLKKMVSWDQFQWPDENIVLRSFKSVQGIEKRSLNEKRWIEEEISYKADW